MISVAIIEDEVVYANELKALLLQWAHAKTELEISCYMDAISLFSYQNPKNFMDFDIIFIDIQLGQMDGITMAQKLRTMGFRNTIVFTTNFANRAIDGYKVNAYRYFLKPVELHDIKDCMGYVLNKIAGDYFQYTYHGLTSRIAYADIICFESMQHYVDIFTIDKTIHIKSLLKDIQKQCPAYFIRCQRSYIVNNNYIKQRMGKELLLQNNKIVDIAPRYSKAVANIMKDVKNHDKEDCRKIF